MNMINTNFFRDMGVMCARSMRHITRSVDTIITVTLMPIAFMLLFVYVFGGAIQTGTDNYVNYLLSGILLLAIASGISYTAYRLFIDMQRGIFERLHAMPISRSTILWGHVLTSLAANCHVGCRHPSRRADHGLPILGRGSVMACRSRYPCVIHAGPDVDRGNCGTVSQIRRRLKRLLLSDSLPAFISSAFVPTRSMPSLVRAFAENQPVNSIVDAVRSLLMGQPVGQSVWLALAWCLAILIAAYIVAMIIYRRKLS